MQMLVLHHLKIEDLPIEWATNLPIGQTFTITIESEETLSNSNKQQVNPLFGIWQDNPAVSNVDTYVRELRKGYFHAG